MKFGEFLTDLAGLYAGVRIVESNNELARPAVEVSPVKIADEQGAVDSPEAGVAGFSNGGVFLAIALLVGVVAITRAG